MTMRFKIHVLAMLVVGLVGVAAAQNAPRKAPQTTDPLPVAEFQLADYRDSVVLVDFWASWCVPCRHSLPWLNAMQQKYADQGLQVVMINLDKDPARAAKMAATIVPGIHQFLDPAGDLAARYELEGMPSSYLYDRSGELISSHLGFLKAEEKDREQALVAALERTEPK